MADDEYTEPEECKEDECYHPVHKEGRCKCCFQTERNIREWDENRNHMKRFREGERYAYQRVAELLGLNWREKDQFQKLVCEGRY